MKEDEDEKILNKILDLEEMLLLKQREMEWIHRRIEYLKKQLNNKK